MIRDRRSIGLAVAFAAWINLGCAESATKTEALAISTAERGSATGSFRAPPAAAMAPAAEPDAPPISTAPAAGGEAAIPPAQPRKIIYTGRVDLVTESFPLAEKNLLALVKAEGGYVSNADVGGETGSQRRGSWTVRVPVDRYEAFIASASRLGETQSVHSDSQDVGMEYHDLEARIAAKLQEEKRLLKHLDESTGKLEDILGVERELSRVRTEAEQMQGRIRYLGNMTALSTVTVTLVEIKDYVPPAAPNFASKVRRSFANSVDGLRRFGENAAIGAVAIVPWLAIIIPGLAIVAVAARSVVKKLRR